MNIRYRTPVISLAMVMVLFGQYAIAQPSLPNARPDDSQQVGRMVRVVSLSFNQNQQPFEKILERVDGEGAKGTDLIVLPETWRGQTDESIESLDGQTISRLAALAKQHQTYIISPIDRSANDCRFNSAVVIDRKGEVSGVYDKIYPYWGEFKHKRPVLPGSVAPVIETDFGKVGIAICFDVNFPEVWQALDNNGAELVVWPSAYSAGRHLQAYALLHHYYIVTATYRGDCQVYDITGKRLIDNHNSNDFDHNTSAVNVTRVTLDLDRGIYHTNFNITKRDQLLREHGDKIEQELYLKRESWFVLKATQPNVSARELAKQYGLEELRHYIARSRREIDMIRNQGFAGKDVNGVSAPVESVNRTLKK